MLEKFYKILFLFIHILVINTNLFAQGEIKTSDYQFVYIALDQDDNVNYQKLINELKKLKSEFSENKQPCVLYFTKGMIRFSSNQLDEWEKIYPLINGNGITHLYSGDEIDNMLNVFNKYEFSTIVKNRLSTSKYSSVIWHCFIGNGFWQAENNKNILGILIASCGINDSYGTNFQLKIYHDSDEIISNFKTENALGRYYNFITDNNTILKEY